MTVSSLRGHLRVAVSGRVIAERDLDADGYGLFGFEVSAGQLSLRKWRIVRRDAYRIVAPAADSKDAIDATRLPHNAQVPRLRHTIQPNTRPMRCGTRSRARGGRSHRRARRLRRPGARYEGAGRGSRSAGGEGGAAVAVRPGAGRWDARAVRCQDRAVVRRPRQVTEALE